MKSTQFKHALVHFAQPEFYCESFKVRQNLADDRHVQILLCQM